MWSSAIHHDVFGLQIAMDDAVAVDVVQRIADAQRDSYGALRRKFLLLVEDFAQQPAIDPFHHHVDLAAVAVGVHLHHAGMIEGLADILLAMKAVEEDRVAFHFRDEEP